MTDFVQITENKKDILKARINPDVIHNRFDLLYNETDWDLYDLKDLVIPVKIVDDHLIVGLYLVKADQKLLLEFFDFLFKKYDKKSKQQPDQPGRQRQHPTQGAALPV